MNSDNIASKPIATEWWTSENIPSSPVETNHGSDKQDIKDTVWIESLKPNDHVWVCYIAFPNIEQSRKTLFELYPLETMLRVVELELRLLKHLFLTAKERLAMHKKGPKRLQHDAPTCQQKRPRSDTKTHQESKHSCLSSQVKSWFPEEHVKATPMGNLDDNSWEWRTHATEIIWELFETKKRRDLEPGGHLIARQVVMSYSECREVLKPLLPCIQELTISRFERLFCLLAIDGLTSINPLLSKEGFTRFVGILLRPDADGIVHPAYSIPSPMRCATPTDNEATQKQSLSDDSLTLLKPLLADESRSLGYFNLTACIDTTWNTFSRSKTWTRYFSPLARRGYVDQLFTNDPNCEFIIRIGEPYLDNRGPVPCFHCGFNLVLSLRHPVYLDGIWQKDITLFKDGLPQLSYDSLVTAAKHVHE